MGRRKVRRKGGAGEGSKEKDRVGRAIWVGPYSL